MTKVHLVTVHGLNTTNSMYFLPWLEAVPEFEEMQHHFVKWYSRSWHDDLLNTYLSKVYRDTQIQKVIDAIQDREGEPCFLLSHSWGTVWTYKALHRLGESIKGPVWSIMCGAALGGTNLPFGGIYVNQIIPQYRNEESSKKIERLFNLYNQDDYVSSRIYMPRMENYKIDVGGFHPGFQEHDITYYLKTMEFRHILNQFMEKYPLK